jgi:hypothetical protein
MLDWNLRVVSAPKLRKYPRIAPKISNAMMLVRLMPIADRYGGKSAEFQNSFRNPRSEIRNYQRHWRSAAAT